MPPHWFIPIRSSDPKARKKDVEHALANRPGSSLQSFWKTPDGAQLYAVIQSNDLSHDLLRDIHANGRPIAMEDV